MSAQKVVLIACGSFNPPTNMHLRMFELARDYLQRGGKYNVIAGIMSPVSDGYNKKDLASSKHRCEMVKLALKSSKWIRLDTWECEQPTWTETEKVLSHHRVQLNNQANSATRCTPSKKRRKDKKNEGPSCLTPDVIDRNHDNSPHRSNRDDVEHVQLKLLCGGDLLESFSVPGLWKDEDIETIVKNYGLLCITRGGSDPRKFIYESDVLTRNQDNIHIVTEWIQNEISSTKIRRALRRSESVKYLLQDSVIDYIRDHGLYGVARDNKYIEKATPSPQNEVMDYVDGSGNPRELKVDTRDTMPRSPAKMLTENSDTGSPRSPRLYEISAPRSPKMAPGSPKITPGSPKTAPGSPKTAPGSPQIITQGSPKRAPASPRTSGLCSPRRFMDEDDGSNSPKSPQPSAACLTPDIGNIVRRVRNVRVGFTPETRVFAYTATETCV